PLRLVGQVTKFRSEVIDVARGGHSRSGPAPDPNALRRGRPSDQAEWVKLPASGRQGPTPEWPLSAPTKRERELWERAWTRPQAIMWERNGQELEVAMFVRSVVAAERKDAPTNARTLVRQQMDSLGISSPGMRSLRWSIVDDAPVSRRKRGGGGSVRDRLQ